MKNKDRYWDCLDLAMEASRGGRTAEAVAWLDEALIAHPEGAEAHNGLGEIFWSEERAEEALHHFELAVKADAKFLTAHLNRAELLIEEMAEFQQAIAQCDALLGARGEPRLDRSSEAEIYYLKSKALFYLDDLAGALFLVRRAIKAAPDVAVYCAFEGQISFERGEFEEARRQLGRAVLLDPESPHALYHQGLALERLGDGRESLRSFQRAHALDAENYPMPSSIEDEDFERVAAEALDALPETIREHIANVPLLVRDYPDDDQVREGLSPQLLGLYVGTPLTEAGAADQPQGPECLYLFKKNLEKAFRTRAELVEQIQVTVTHEVGHHFGLDDDDLERLGLG